MATVTRRDLAVALKEACGGTITDNDYWIQCFVDIVSQKVSEHGRVEIRGFGSFNLNTIRAHTTVNPGGAGKEGEPLPELHVPETYTVDFRASSLLKERLKADRAKKDEADE
ncbi:MAG TPA: hypothetical protein EYO33_14370 [Phycisphaerales bacterium]|nr:hypothetical protein [Phycisphaerales bacterium]